MFLLVDGSNLLYQMFFGMPARIINKDGKAIQGTLGFVGALIKINDVIASYVLTYVERKSVFRQCIMRIIRR